MTALVGLIQVLQVEASDIAGRHGWHGGWSGGWCGGRCGG
eukprot:CAMPEP_0119307598 /NCGR_PEP_ID=MMETSP1333-20130426/8053_1 /TAXON_ID=418940 /ORGANISM="Scyphosphaera apsteinii, Strain RCC1455" /LENGTH=39 /DNA_ID= /DNA_START= /DNA_END= /DNA_ORIENTATION=